MIQHPLLKVKMIILSILVLSVFNSCELSKNAWISVQNANLFTIEDDIAIGKQVSKDILDNPKDFPILNEKKNKPTYQYINNLVDEILATGEIRYKDDFAWEVKIIDNPEIQNAFATPGGYIFVYTGLISFLDTGDQLAGVIGHEMAHADLRHSTRQLTDRYGVAVLSELLLGKQKGAVQLTDALFALSFSRGHETEADAFSVDYLCGTKYNATGAAAFFEKIEGQAQPPVFLSTHPNPENRVQSIKNRAKQLSCTGHYDDRLNYEKMKNSIVSTSNIDGKNKGKGHAYH